MAMEKHGVITDETPPEPKSCTSGACRCRPPVKQSADSLEDHASKRAADAVTDKMKANK